MKKNERWSPPTMGILKFNVDVAGRGKTGLAGVGGVLHNHEGMTFLFLLSLELKIRMKLRF